MALNSGIAVNSDSLFQSGTRERTVNREITECALRAACAMEMRKRMAVRAARRAVTGPWTTEYGPWMAGKKKMPRTQRTANIASSHPMRPGVIEVPYLLYLGAWGLLKPIALSSVWVFRTGGKLFGR